MSQERSMPLREQAMEALEESTKILEVACNLMEQGNRKEAERLHKAARTKRRVSVLLMAKANALENASRKGRSHYHEVDSSRAH
jgi:hypothetical protein